MRRALSGESRTYFGYEQVAKRIANIRLTQIKGVHHKWYVRSRLQISD